MVITIDLVKMTALENIRAPIDGTIALKAIGGNGATVTYSGMDPTQTRKIEFTLLESLKQNARGYKFQMPISFKHRTERGWTGTSGKKALFSYSCSIL